MIAHRSRRNRTTSTPIRPQDVIVTGCGRVYAFPADTPQFARPAGPGHHAYRIGYIEPSEGAWLARDFGNWALGTPSPSRMEALNRVLRAAGHHLTPAVWPEPELAGRTVPVPRSLALEYGHVFVDALGLVFLGKQGRGGHAHLRRRLHLGAVWATAGRFAALPHLASSSAMTTYTTRRAAIRSLIPPAPESPSAKDSPARVRKRTYPSSLPSDDST